MILTLLFNFQVIIAEKCLRKIFKFDVENESLKTFRFPDIDTNLFRQIPIFVDSLLHFRPKPLLREDLENQTSFQRFVRRQFLIEQQHCVRLKHMSNVCA